MSEFTLSKGFLLKLHTNKNSNIFKKAAEALVAERNNSNSELDLKVGINYDDFNADPKITQKWKLKFLHQ